MGLTAQNGKWGGIRPGSGRPKGRRTVARVARPRLSGRAPLHVTLRLRDGAPRLRKHHAYDVLRTAFREGKNRFGFRLNHYSVQSNHIHLVCEADDTRGLSRGMQGLAVRIARRINKAHDRRGRLFSDRYHLRVLETPTQIRRTLLYVLRNGVHHQASPDGPIMDVYSSASYFEHWAEPRLPAIDEEVEPAVTPARTWLLTTGWLRAGGPLSFEEVPVVGGALFAPGPTTVRRA